MHILFVSDYVCPYCLVAKEALKQALLETGLEPEITWQPLELTPEPKERVDTYHDEKKRAGYQILVEPCKLLGLDMKLPPKVVPRPYTRLAFEGWYYAQEKGRGEEFNDLVYRAYFIEEQDIGQMEVLTELARRVGLNGEEFTEVLQNGIYSQVEKEAVDYSRNTLKPGNVPAIYINDKRVSIQEFTKEEMIRILNEEAVESDFPGFGCGEDGCSFGGDDEPSFGCGEDGCSFG